MTPGSRISLVFANSGLLPRSEVGLKIGQEGQDCSDLHPWDERAMSSSESILGIGGWGAGLVTKCRPLYRRVAGILHIPTYTTPSIGKTGGSALKMVEIFG